MSELTQFQQQAVALGLQKMLRGSFYDICAVREAAGLLGRVHEMDSPDGRALRMVHCVPWGNMTPQMRNEVVQRTMTLLGLDLAMAEQVAEQAAPAQKPGTFLSFFRK